MNVLSIIKPKRLKYMQMIIDLFEAELFVHHNIFVEFLFEFQMSMEKKLHQMAINRHDGKKIAIDFQSPHKDSI